MWRTIVGLVVGLALAWTGCGDCKTVTLCGDDGNRYSACSGVPTGVVQVPDTCCPANAPVVSGSVSSSASSGSSGSHGSSAGSSSGSTSSASSGSGSSSTTSGSSGSSAASGSSGSHGSSGSSGSHGSTGSSASGSSTGSTASSGSSGSHGSSGSSGSSGSTTGAAASTTGSSVTDPCDLPAECRPQRVGQCIPAGVVLLSDGGLAIADGGAFFFLPDGGNSLFDAGF